MNKTSSDKEAARDEVIKLLSDLQSHYATYHNHKETSAWVAFALYTGLFVHLIVSEKIVMCRWETFIAVIVMVIAVIAIECFLCKQLSLRREAAGYVAACIYLRAYYLSHPNKEIKAHNFVSPSLKGGEVSNKSTCCYVKRNKRRGEGSRCLPKIVLKLAGKLRDDSSRKPLERLIYWGPPVLTVLAIAHQACRCA